MLLFFLLAVTTEAVFSRWMFATYDAVSATAPNLFSVLDVGHVNMSGFGPYTSQDISNFDVQTSLWLKEKWDINTTGCIPNAPFPGMCALFRNGSPIGALVPYKSNRFTAYRDTEHNNIKENNWEVQIYGNIVVLAAGVTLPTARGNQTAKANDAILYLEENWIRGDKYPYTGNNRYVYKVRSSFYTTFPINSQGFQNQLAMFDVYDDDENRCDGVLTSITNYVSGTSGLIKSQNRLIHTCD